MKAILDHVGIAVQDFDAALAFYRGALGLEIEPPEEVPSQRVRAHFIPSGNPASSCWKRPRPSRRSRRSCRSAVQGCITSPSGSRTSPPRSSQLKARGTRLIDDRPRPGADGALVAFIHPAAAHGVLVELKQTAPVAAAGRLDHGGPRHQLGDLELITVNDGFLALDGGAMFGVVPKPLWSRKAPPDSRNRVTLAMRPLIVRGARTMIIDAGVGDKENAKFSEIYGLDRARHLDHTLAEAGLSAEDVDIVLATHLHFDHAGGFTVRDRNGRLRPRFPRAQYVVRRGEWEDANHPNERNRASYLADNYLPLADAGVLQLVDDDQTIMPGVKVRRTGGHTMHHQMVIIESGGRAAAFAADLIPTTAHVPNAWIMAFDLYPMDTLTAKNAFVREAIDRDMLIFFEHDPAIAAGYIREEDGRRRVVPA